AHTLLYRVENDQRQGEVAALPEAPVELDPGLGGANALVVVAVDAALAARERAVDARLLQLVSDLLRELQSLARVVERAGAVDRTVHHREIDVRAARNASQ